MKKILIALLCCILFFSCKNNSALELPYFNSSDFTPEWLAKTDPGFKKLHTIPDFEFTDQDNHLVSGKTTAGKIYVANFFFTRCGNICPKMMDNMKKVADAFAGDNSVLIISHSVTPHYDKVSILKKYASDKNITGPNWHLVTGDKDAIYRIARCGYFADTVTKSAITTQFLHTENFILVDKLGHIRGVYNGTIDLEVNNLVRHIRMLKEEN